MQQHLSSTMVVSMHACAYILCELIVRLANHYDATAKPFSCIYGPWHTRQPTVFGSGVRHQGNAQHNVDSLGGHSAVQLTQVFAPHIQDCQVLLRPQVHIHLGIVLRWHMICS
eukprot:365940-Chlamydomonas_euryale.AAC.18